LAYEILRSAFVSSRVILPGREDRVAVAPPGSHRPDIVLADEPAWSNFKMRAFDHRLGRSSVTFLRSAGVVAQLMVGGLRYVRCLIARRGIQVLFGKSADQRLEGV
jgi:hypothetical protein